MIGVEPDWHEVGNLRREPEVEILGHTTDEVTTDEDVEDRGNERDFLFQRDGGSVIPSLVDIIDRFLHPAPVLGQLLIGGGNSFSPFSHGTVFCIVAGGPYPLLAF